MKEKEIDKIESVESTKIDAQFESNADQLEQQLEISEEGKKKTASTVFSFLKSYIKKPQDMSRREWLEGEFKKYPELWSDGSEPGSTAKEIVETIDEYERKRNELAEWRKSGKSRESWIAKSIEETGAISGAMSAGEYAGRIEATLEAANKANLEQIYTQSGAINMQRNLDGFIAEQHHVNTFNLDAATQNKPYRAEVLLPGEGQTYGKNSVDVVIKNIRTGKIVRRYQAKYGADAEATTGLFEHGDYRGQRRLVPKGQSVERSTDIIEIDGCKSKPLSKAEAKRLQERAQERESVKKYKWDAIDKIQAVKAIGKQSAIAAAIAVGFQGARILGRRIWNGITGKENPTVEEDIKEFAETSLQSGATVGLTTAMTGGLTIAAKSGWLGATAKSLAKGNVIASAVCIAVENVKTVKQLGNGEITCSEALDKVADSTASFVAGAKGFAIGGKAGAVLGGVVLGPVGAFVGGVAGGIAGAMVGSKVGHAIYEGGKTVAKTVMEGAKKVYSAVSSGAKKVWDFFFG